MRDLSSYANDRFSLAPSSIINTRDSVPLTWGIAWDVLKNPLTWLPALAYLSMFKHLDELTRTSCLLPFSILRLRACNRRQYVQRSFRDL